MKYFGLFILAVLIQFVFGHEAAGKESENKKPTKDKNIYYELFKEKRKSHLAAVKRIIELNDPNKQNEMMSVAVKKIFEVLKKSMNKLSEAKENNKDQQNEKEFWSDVSSVVENTAFVADLALHFPKNFHKMYDRRHEWRMTLHSAIDVTQRSQMADPETLKTIYLLEQEVGIRDKDEDFVNPYKQSKVQQRANIVIDSPPKKKVKKNRGPGLSGQRIDL